LLKLLHIRDIQVQRMRGWLLPLRQHGTRAGRDKNGCDCGALQRFHRAPASISSPWNRLLRIYR
jgi:hypothetical protein